MAQLQAHTEHTKMRKDKRRKQTANGKMRTIWTPATAFRRLVFSWRSPNWRGPCHSGAGSFPRSRRRSRSDRTCRRQRRCKEQCLRRESSKICAKDDEHEKKESTTNRTTHALRGKIKISPTTMADASNGNSHTFGVSVYDRNALVSQSFKPQLSCTWFQTVTQHSFGNTLRSSAEKVKKTTSNHLEF